MTDFKAGDRVEVVQCVVSDLGSAREYIGRRGTVLKSNERLSCMEVELDGDDHETYLYSEELRLLPPVPKQWPLVITREEWEHQTARFQQEIDHLNDVLDEIRGALPEGDNLTWYAVECADACFKIGQIIDKRPERP